MVLQRERCKLNTALAPVVHSRVYSMKDRLDLIAQRIQTSQVNPQERQDGSQYMLRDLALEIVRGTPQHGLAAEDAMIARIFWWTKTNIEYRNEYRSMDAYHAAGRTIASRANDCFTLDTKIIVRSKATSCYELRTLDELQGTWPAYDALSYDFSSAEWVFKPITNWHKKERQEVWETRLENGPSVYHTPDHKVWWYDGSGPHGQRRVEQRELGSALEEERGYFRRVLVAKKIPALRVSDLSSAQSYLSGIYAAEGYYSNLTRAQRSVYIAQDREDVRQRIIEALDRTGTAYTPSRRDVHASFYVKASPMGEWLRRQGRTSFDKRIAAEVFGGSEDLVRVALEAHGDGDAYRPKPGSVWAKKAKAIHATSSRGLSDDLQLMCMILGEAWHTQFQVRHGGSGNSPIYRVHRWTDRAYTSRRFVEGLPGVSYSGVRHTTPVSDEETVACITVADTHNFVLSNGMISHNCDDHLIVNAAMLDSLGFLTGARCTSPDNVSWHTYCIVGRNTFAQPSEIIPLDTTQPESFPGWEPEPSMRRYMHQCTFKDGRVVYLRKVQG
jgi:hypothetical protein